MIALGLYLLVSLYLIIKTVRLKLVATDWQMVVVIVWGPMYLLAHAITTFGDYLEELG